jgi:7-cyano-7-deazaguanine synthase in queuosine biosynthesis
METSDPLEQPYYHSKNTSLLFAVHGTISNDAELAKKYKVKIGADTEILRYLEQDNFSELEGSFCTIGISDPDEEFIITEKGLKLFQSRLFSNKEYLADIIATTSLDIFDCCLHDHQNNDTLFVSFSGGMDISLSTFKELATNNYKKVILNYFAWGSVAEFAELGVLDKFKDFYETHFKMEVVVKVWNAASYFDEYFKMTEAPIPRISKNNSFYTGEKSETESPLAYVPYRNTQFALLLASHAEAMNLKKVNILMGLNLSEGMVYMDNSEGWLRSISETIKYGGKDPKVAGTYRVIAPYFSRTKTNMLKEFKLVFGEDILDQILKISTSCYYPGADGSDCGKCGSCILKEKAMKNAK